ncbi:unnamed protein product [Coccothraustes coccothraustes]
MKKVLGGIRWLGLTWGEESLRVLAALRIYELGLRFGLLCLILVSEPKRRAAAAAGKADLDASPRSSILILIPVAIRGLHLLSRIHREEECRAGREEGSPLFPSEQRLR